ncbi:chaplin family protein [Streptomyces sp. NPDC055632]
MIAESFMMTRTLARGTVVTLTLLGAGQAASPAWAGGVGDFLSPAFGTSCANHHTGARADGTTTHGTGAANGNLAGLPLGSPLNQCGGADILALPVVDLHIDTLVKIFAIVV